MATRSSDLLAYKEIYRKAADIIAKGTANAPEWDPYRSVYKGRELLYELRKRILESVDTIPRTEKENCPFNFKYTIILGAIYCDLGRIGGFTQEFLEGIEALNRSLEYLTPHKLHAAGVTPYMGALNELAIIYAGRENYPKSFDTLRMAEKTYNDFNALKIDPITLLRTFGVSDDDEDGTGEGDGDGRKELETIFTLTSFYLAQVYGHLGQLEKSAIYCHRTLRRQLASKEFEPLDFGLSAATLSQYFIGNNMFYEARHHLSTSMVVLTNYERVMHKPEMNPEEKAMLSEQFKHRSADVARCWAKYGLHLLSSSKDRLFTDESENAAANDKNQEIAKEPLVFPNLDVSEFEKQITADYCLDFNDAKPVYHFVHKWLDLAKEYYNAETEATEYSKITKDFAELYEQMAFFEDNLDNQYKMQRRRARYFEELVNLLNPQYYMVICQESWCGAGLAYCAMLDIKLEQKKEKGEATPQELHTINQICTRAIRHFEDYLKSITENKDGFTIKAGSHVEEKRTILYAFFHLGRLYFKMTTNDPVRQLEQMTKSCNYHKQILLATTKHPEATKSMLPEIGICKEMVNLLPHKISLLSRRLEGAQPQGSN